MHVEVSARADAGRDGGVLLAADPGAADRRRRPERIAPLLKALADPVRLRLLSLVASHADGEACVCDLNDAFDLSQPTISHHLKVLHEVGLLDRDQAWRLGLLPRPRRGARATWAPCSAASPRDASGPRVVAEFVGTAFLVAAVVGSGIAASGSRPDDVGPAAAREQPGHRGRAGRADPGAAAGLGGLQPGRDPGRARPGPGRTRDAALLVAAQVLGGVLGVRAWRT